jgi:hypothetical protein
MYAAGAGEYPSDMCPVSVMDLLFGAYLETWKYDKDDIWVLVG